MVTLYVEEIHKNNEVHLCVGQKYTRKNTYSPWQQKRFINSNSFLSQSRENVLTFVLFVLANIRQADMMTNLLQRNLRKKNI